MDLNAEQKLPTLLFPFIDTVMTVHLFGLTGIGVCENGAIH